VDSSIRQTVHSAERSSESCVQIAVRSRVLRYYTSPSSILQLTTGKILDGFPLLQYTKYSEKVL